MTNEAVCIETPTIFARRVIAAAAVLPVGTITKLTDDNTVEATAADNDPFGGIVWEIASTAATTFTEITTAMDGVWDVKDSGAGGSAGAIVNVGGANTYCLICHSIQRYAFYLKVSILAFIAEIINSNSS